MNNTSAFESSVKQAFAPDHHKLRIDAEHCDDTRKYTRTNAQQRTDHQSVQLHGITKVVFCDM
jgi:hypothetical protein